MNRVTIADLLHLSVAERLKLVGNLWDSITTEGERDPHLLPVTEEQRSLLRRRSESYRAIPGAAIPLDEALERIERGLA